MKIQLLFVTILINLSCILSGSVANIDFKESIITAPNAGLVLLHQGQYRPANHIIYNTAMFPMTASTCYLVPIAAARKIPACNNFTEHIRNKRLITDIIAITTSSIALGTATTSLILTKNLEKRVNQFETNMRIMSDRLETGDARMVQFEKNELRMGMILQQSQQLLNSTIAQVNQNTLTLQTHDNQLNEHQRILTNLTQRVINNEQATVNRFLYLAIRDIFNNQPTLGYLDPSDMYLVVKGILQENNITIPEAAEQLPIVEIITKFIVRQQIDFIPVQQYSDNPGGEIGKLTFTTFYAMPNEQRSDFNIYKVITGPFVHGKKVVQLAQMPVYIGINSKEKASISWTDKDLSSCVFQLMTTCRETPSEKLSHYGNKCLEQILTGNTIRSCRIEQTKIDLPYIQQLQNGRWLISTNNSILHCIRTPTQRKPSSVAAIWSENTEVIIPPTAIVTVPNGTTIHCPEFNLPGPIIPDARPIINIIKNLSSFEEDKEIIDIHKDLVANSTWEKIPYVKSEIDELIQDMLAQTAQTGKGNNAVIWHNQHSGKIMLALSAGIGLLVIIAVMLVWYVIRSKNSKITIALPKALL